MRWSGGWLRSLSVDEWLVTVVQSMYLDATTVDGRDSKVFGVKVGIHEINA